MAGAGIASAALGAPPFLDAVGRAGGGIEGGADEDGAGVGLGIVDAVGDGDAVCLGGEVVVADELRGPVPLGAGILEVADEFLLLGVDADDGRFSAAQCRRSPAMCWNWASRCGCEAPARFLWLTRRAKPIVPSNRATVRGHTSMPSERSSAAILAVVRRVHLSPVMGSPAVSAAISASMRARISGVFFPRPCARRRGGARGRRRYRAR